MSKIVKEMRIAMENILKEVEKMQDIVEEYNEFVENNCKDENLVKEFDEIAEIFTKIDKIWKQSLQKMSNQRKSRQIMTENFTQSEKIRQIY